MMKSYCFKLISCLFMLMASTLTLAAVPDWQIVPNESTLTFTATQNGSPVSGSFKRFTGDIHFNPDQLDANKVKIVVDMSSVSTSYGEVAETLVTPDWFNVKSFPQAVFTATNFTKTGDKTYEANGNLTIRDKTLPVVLKFVEKKYSPTKATVEGSATLKRSSFGVGQGDWAKTDEVKDDVNVTFTLSVIKK